MSGSTSGQADPDHGQDDQAVLRVASGQDAADAAQRADRLQQILARADARDQAAERRAGAVAALRSSVLAQRSCAAIWAINRRSVDGSDIGNSRHAVARRSRGETAYPQCRALPASGPEAMHSVRQRGSDPESTRRGAIGPAARPRADPLGSEPVARNARTAQSRAGGHPVQCFARSGRSRFRLATGRRRSPRPFQSCGTGRRCRG